MSPCSLVPARHEPTLTRGRIEAEAADPPGSTPASNWCHRSRPSPLRECCRFLKFFPFSPPSLYFKKFEDFTHHGHLALYQILGSNTPWTQGPAYIPFAYRKRHISRKIKVAFASGSLSKIHLCISLRSTCGEISPMSSFAANSKKIYKESPVFSNR